jgi:hypothetical protein
MKPIKKDQSFSKEYYPVVFWREDLEELTEAMSALGSGVTLSTERYEFESLEDAAKYFGSRVQHEFKIGSKASPWAEVQFSRTTTHLHVYRGSDSVKIFHELDEIVKRRQRFAAPAYNMFLVITVAFVGAAVANLPEKTVGLWSIVPGLLTFPWFIWAAFMRMRRNSVLIFQPRSQARPFFERNKDQLLMYLITFVLGGLLVFVSTQLKDRLFPPSNTSSTTK